MPSDPSQHQGQRLKSPQVQDGCHPFQKPSASCSPNELHSCESFGNRWPGPQKLSQQGLRGSHFEVEGEPAYNAAYRIKYTFDASCTGLSIWSGWSKVPWKIPELKCLFCLFCN